MAVKVLVKDGKLATYGGKVVEVEASAADAIQHADIPDYIKTAALAVAQKVAAVRTPESIVFWQLPTRISWIQATAS